MEKEAVEEAVEEKPVEAVAEEKGPLSGFEEFSVEESAEKVPEEVEAPETEEEAKETEETEEAAETVKETKEESFEFKAPEEEEAPEETWKNIGQDLELPIEGEEFEDFKKAYADKINQVGQEAYEQGLEEAPEASQDLTDENRNLLQLANEGINLKEYLDPINTIDGWLKYDNKTLLKEDLESKIDRTTGERVYTDEEISEKIERYEDNETLKDRADDLREDLRDEKQSITEEIIEKQNYQAEEARTQQEQAVQAQSQYFINTVNSTEEFMGGKIGEDVKQHVTSMWNNGEVHELFNDPKKIVDYVLYHSVGDQVMKQRDNQAFNNGQSKAKKSLHNIPPVTTTGGANRGVEETPTDEAGDFSEWENAMKNLRAE